MRVTHRLPVLASALLLAACWAALTTAPRRPTTGGPVHARPADTSTVRPTSLLASPTPTSNRPPPRVWLVAPADGAVLAQPVAPATWHFEWGFDILVCGARIVISGPGGRHIEAYAGFTYTYSTSEPIPDDALTPWRWQVFVSCPSGPGTQSPTRSFSVLSAGPTATTTVTMTATMTATMTTTATMTATMTATATPSDGGARPLTLPVAWRSGAPDPPGPSVMPGLTATDTPTATGPQSTPTPTSCRVSDLAVTVADSRDPAPVGRPFHYELTAIGDVQRDVTVMAMLRDDDPIRLTGVYTVTVPGLPAECRFLGERWFLCHYLYFSGETKLQLQAVAEPVAGTTLAEFCATIDFEGCGSDPDPVNNRHCETTVVVGGVPAGGPLRGQPGPGRAWAAVGRRPVAVDCGLGSRYVSTR